MLVAEDVRKQFSGLTALDGVTLSVGGDEILGLVGPNGSGKSTLLNALSGFMRPDSGAVTFGGERVERKQPWDVAALGLRRTFQLPSMPQRMTVLEVMLSGARMTLGGTAWASLLRPRAVRAEQDAQVLRARELLDEMTLLPLEHHAAGVLSGGQQKLLSLGAALMGNPRMLLLDEPTAGVNPTLRKVLVERLKTVNERGTALMIVEHDMAFVAELCARCYVLDKGKVITCCPPSELAKDPRVVKAYLGSAPMPAAAAQTLPDVEPGVAS